MCYSAMVVQGWREYERRYGATISLKDFARLYGYRLEHPRLGIPKAMDLNVAEPQNEDERNIAEMIARYNLDEVQRLEQDLFKQKKRLADAERKLLTKQTKKALEDQRIANEKIPKLLRWLSDLRRTELKPIDSRIFPMDYTPVMVEENGRRVVKPMRYHCRPAGMPPSFDRHYAGCYNARRDNIEKFWKGQFGSTHGVMLITGFFEHVPRHTYEHRPLPEGEKAEDLILEFRPRPEQVMAIACLCESPRESRRLFTLSQAAIA